jgi:hypothetical protein
MLFAFTASNFLLLAQEKVTKEKGTPAFGFAGCAGKLPSLRHCFGGRFARAIHGPANLSPHPCGSSPYATPPLGLLTGLAVYSRSVGCMRRRRMHHGYLATVWETTWCWCTRCNTPRCGYWHPTGDGVFGAVGCMCLWRMHPGYVATVRDTTWCWCTRCNTPRCGYWHPTGCVGHGSSLSVLSDNNSRKWPCAMCHMAICRVALSVHLWAFRGMDGVFIHPPFMSALAGLNGVRLRLGLVQYAAARLLAPYASMAAADVSGPAITRHWQQT